MTARQLSAQQVADRYGLTVQWVYQCKTLPRHKVGKYLVFYEDELLEFEEAGRSGWREPERKVQPEPQKPVKTAAEPSEVVQEMKPPAEILKLPAETVIEGQLSVADICRLEKVNYQSVYRWVRSGLMRADLRPVMQGGRLGLWFEKEDYERFRQARHRTTSVQTA